MKIINSYFGGIGEPAYGWCPPSIYLGNESYRKKVNINPVKKLMDEYKNPKDLLIEGLKEIGENPNPTNMDITILSADTDDSAISYSELIKEIYDSALDTNIKIQYIDWKEYDETLANGQYQISGMGWAGDYNDPMSFFEVFKSDSTSNHTGFNNKQYDDLILKASQTTPNSERIKYFEKAENLLVYEEGVISPIMYRKSNFFYDKKIKNLYFSQIYGPEFKYVEIK